MLFGNKNESKKNAPDDTAVFKDIAVGLWRVKDKSGNDTFRFSFSRVDDKKELRRSFKPEHLPEFAGALYGLANAFAKAPSLDAELRKELARLAFVWTRRANWRRPTTPSMDPLTFQASVSSAKQIVFVSRTLDETVVSSGSGPFENQASVTRLFFLNLRPAHRGHSSVRTRSEPLFRFDLWPSHILRMSASRSLCCGNGIGAKRTELGPPRF